MTQWEVDVGSQTGLWWRVQNSGNFITWTLACLHVLLFSAQIVQFIYHQQNLKLFAVFVHLLLVFRRISITIACWCHLIWIQGHWCALHAIVLKWLWPTQELLINLMLTSMLEFWYGGFQVFVWDKSSTLLLTNVFCPPAGLWTGPRKPCKFCFHFNDLPLIVTLPQCWKFPVLLSIWDKSYSTL